MQERATDAPTISIETFGFGKASSAQLQAFLDQGMFDATKANSRMRNLLRQAIDEPAAASKLAFAAARSADGQPAGLAMIERLERQSYPALLLKNPFRSDSKPNRQVDKSFELSAWFMAYTAPELRGQGIASIMAQAAERIIIDAAPPAASTIPMVLAVEGAMKVWEKAAKGSYAISHKPDSVNFPASLHHLAMRFVSEASEEEPPLCRPELASWTISDYKPARPTPRA
jgi:GNAT superfamily N-acetyltransferase